MPTRGNRTAMNPSAQKKKPQTVTPIDEKAVRSEKRAGVCRKRQGASKKGGNDTCVTPGIETLTPITKRWKQIGWPTPKRDDVIGRRQKDDSGIETSPSTDSA